MKCRGISNDNILHTCYMLIRCNISIKKFFKKLPGVFYIISSLSVKIFCNTVIVQEWWRFYSLPTLDKKVSQVADMALKLTSMKNPWQKRTVDDLKCLVTWLVTPMKLLNKRSWKKWSMCKPQSTAVQNLTMSHKKSFNHVDSSNRDHLTFKLFSNQIYVMLQSPI